MRLEHETTLHPDQIREGQLLRLHYFREYNRYVRSDIPRSYIAVVVDRREQNSWTVLVGDALRVLIFRGKLAEPQWRLCSTPEQRDWRRDITTVYGEPDV